jgi:hypothetical protein
MRRKHLVFGVGAAVTLSVTGCQLASRKSQFEPGSLGSVSPVTQLKREDPTETANMPNYVEHVSPLDLDESTLTPDRFRSMTLEECITESLQHSRVMRDLGVAVIRAPQAINTNYDPALVYTDPKSGEEAALSAFDANLFASSFYDNNDRAYNNRFFGVNGLFQQSLSTTQLGVNKRSATGALFTVRNVNVYDRNNQPQNLFLPLSWDSYVEAQVRQPLMLGRGTEFNRIAGPGAQPGQLNGVLLARVRTDITLVDFERSVRDHVAEIENAYWDLYYAYRDLDARIQARDIAKDTWEKIKQRETSEGQRAQAEEQYIRFQSEVVDSLNGRAIDGTRTNNGSTGGTFRGIGGIRVTERKLRLLIGVPINDGTLIQPSEQPANAQVTFDWESAIADALTRREELRRQRWVIKQRELELIANRNFLKPQLDAVSMYRVRGFGNSLTFPFYGNSPYEGFQEWTLGLDYQLPVGFRRGNAAVRNSQLALARDSEILKEQERSVHYGLSNALNETKRAFDNKELQRKRLDKIVRQLQEIKEKSDGLNPTELDVQLETHRRLLDARLRYHQAEVEYALALRNVNLEKGTLLPYCNVFLNESSSSAVAVADAMARVGAQDYGTAPHSRDLIIGKPAY